MIEEFLTSFYLFANSYLAGWLIAVVLSLIGIGIVARDQIFLGAAVAQSSTLGIALALWAEGFFGIAGVPESHRQFLHATIGGAFAILAALVTAHAGRSRRETHEAVTGWAFLTASAATVLAVAHSPHGLEEVQTLIASTIIGATREDVAAFAAAAALTILLVALKRRELVLLVTDPEMAGALGVRVALLETIFYVWLGLAVGLSIHVAGTTYAFGCLVFPALAAKNLCLETRSLFVVAPALALASGILAFILANHWDYPPGQVAVAILSVLVAAGWAVRKLREQG